MSERKYSLSEIDRMRRAIEDSFMQWLGPNTRICQTDSRRTEDRLRTYMANGTDPEELERANDDRDVLWRAQDRVAIASQCASTAKASDTE